MQFSQSPVRARRWKRGVLPVLLLAVGVPAAAFGGGPVQPEVLWDAELEAVFVAPPAEVGAWLAGQVDDPTGALAAWYADYTENQHTPAFAGALLEIGDLVQAARAEGAGDDTFTINAFVIPRILEQRGDLRAALRGESSTVPNADGDCWIEIDGNQECIQWWGIFCLRIACKENRDPLRMCKIFMNCRDGNTGPGDIFGR